MKTILVFPLALILINGCQKTETTTVASSDTSATSAAEKTYTMNGKLVSRDAAKAMVTIDNEEVPGGVMAPMVMAYELRGATVETLPPDGTKITSTLHEQGGKYWVTDVKPMP